MRLIRLSAAALLTATAIAFGVSAATAATGAINVYPTRVTALAVPATHEVHSPVKITGTVQAKTGAAWKPAASVAVGYYYRVLPKGKWRHAANGKTNAHGAFALKYSLVKFGHLQWQVRVARQQAASTVYRASNSAVKASHFVDRSYVTRFVAMHLNGYTSLAAIMTDYPPRGGVTYATVTGTAKFYYLPTGSSTWRYLGSSKSNGSGDVALGPGGTLDGTFKIVFPAQANFLGSSAKQSLS
jgi:hypothetical protein